MTWSGNNIKSTNPELFKVIIKYFSIYEYIFVVRYLSAFGFCGHILSTLWESVNMSAMFAKTLSLSGDIACFSNNMSTISTAGKNPKTLQYRISTKCPGFPEFSTATSGYCKFSFKFNDLWKQVESLPRLVSRISRSNRQSHSAEVSFPDFDIS